MKQLCIRCNTYMPIDRPGAKLCSRCFLDAIGDLLFATPPETEKEIDEALRDFGLDPDEVGRWAAGIAKKALAAAESNLQENTS